MWEEDRKVALDMSNNSTGAIRMREGVAYLRHWSKFRVAGQILKNKDVRVRRNTLKISSSLPLLLVIKGSHSHQVGTDLI